jgi:hypothetical protein
MEIKKEIGAFYASFFFMPGTTFPAFYSFVAMYLQHLNYRKRH